MGANNSTRRVSFESDENDNITVVKGIRLSESVINRMREPAAPPKHTVSPPPPPPVSTPAPVSVPILPPPLLHPLPPPFDPITSSPLHLHQKLSLLHYHLLMWKLLNVVLPISIPPAAVSKPVVAPPPPSPVEPAPTLAPATPEPIAPPSVAESVASPPTTKLEQPPAPVGSAIVSSAPVVESVVTPALDVLSPPPAAAEPIAAAAPPLAEFVAPVEATAPPLPQTSASVDPVAPVAEPEVVPEPVAVSPSPPPQPVDEEALKKKITEELTWLESEKARATAHAQAKAQSQVKGEVSRILSAERASAQDNLQQAIIRERIATEDEKRRAHLYAKQLEAIEADLQRRDAFYRDQVARLRRGKRPYPCPFVRQVSRGGGHGSAHYRGALLLVPVRSGCYRGQKPG
ncbi:hypothetical protein WMY93_021621 [Mugilogobius chulae]|uniref:MICOS complex subunit MIC19 n=1 Tax=Mugilogobius chulae TaxID=88201 RepID=A0AAW0NH02_9GOBI